MAKKFNVAALRKRLHLTQAALGELLGINQATVHKIEAGKMVPSKPVQKLLELMASR